MEETGGLTDNNTSQCLSDTLWHLLVDTVYLFHALDFLSCGLVCLSWN